MGYYKDYDDEDDDMLNDENERLFESIDHITDEELEEFFKAVSGIEKKRPKTLILNYSKLKEVKKIYDIVKYLLDECEANYDIKFINYETLRTSVGIKITVDGVDIIDDNFDKLRAIFDVVETLSILPLVNGKISIGMTISDVYTEITNSDVTFDE